MIQLIKNRSDIGAGTRGADLGIDAMEIAAINQGDDFFNRHHYVDLKTDNETIYSKFTSTVAKRIEHVYHQCERVSSAVANSLKQGYFPVVLSGDHSSASGTIAGIQNAYPDLKLGVVWLDAHADIHSPFTSPSGNVHGMPLAAVLRQDNLQNKINEVEEDTAWYWKKMKSIGGVPSAIGPDQLIYFGLRDFEQAELNLIQELNINTFSVAFVRENGLDKTVEDALNKLASCDIMYISFDVDSMDKDAVSDGTGTPVSNGFYPEEIIRIIERILASQKVKCLEIAEINPLLDNQGNKMAATAFQILAQVSKQIEGNAAAL